MTALEQHLPAIGFIVAELIAVCIAYEARWR